MSKYSTEELITNLNCHFYPSPTGDNGDDYRLAIIAKLRAADKLCEVTRKASVALRKVNLGGSADVIDKAIAEFEKGETP